MPRFSNFTLPVSLYYAMASHNTGMPTFSNFILSLCLHFTPCQQCQDFQILLSLCVSVLHHANNTKIFKFYSPCVSLYYPMPSHNTGMPTFSNFTLSVCLYFTPCQAITLACQHFHISPSLCVSVYVSLWHLVCCYNLHF